MSSSRQGALKITNRDERLPLPMALLCQTLLSIVLCSLLTGRDTTVLLFPAGLLLLYTSVYVLYTTTVAIVFPAGYVYHTTAVAIPYMQRKKGNYGENRVDKKEKEKKEGEKRKKG